MAAWGPAVVGTPSQTSRTRYILSCCFHVLSERIQGFVGNAHNAPFGEDLGAELLVKSEGGSVPGKDVPLKPGTAFGDGNLGEMLEEGSADSLPSLSRSDVDVLQAKAVVTAPGAVAGEEEGESGGDAVELSHHAAEARCGAEAVPEQIGFGGEHCVRLALI